MTQIGKSRFKLGFAQVNMFLTGIGQFHMTTKESARATGLTLRQGRAITRACFNLLAQGEN